MNTGSFFTALVPVILLGGFVLAYFQGVAELEKQHNKKRQRSSSQRSRPLKEPKQPIKPAKPSKPGPSPETVEAMHRQADAERAIAEALERKAQHVTDPVKRARIDKQASNSWLRFHRILDQVDKLTASE